MYSNDYFTQQGWQCPICKRVYSPSQPMCPYCGNNDDVEYSTSTNFFEPYIYEYNKKDM